MLSAHDRNLLRVLPALEQILKSPRQTWRGYAQLASELEMDCTEFALLVETFVQNNNAGLRTPDEVWNAADEILQVMLNAVAEGVQSKQETQVTPGDWGQRLFRFDSLFGSLWSAFAGAIAAQEHNAGMGVVAAAPTGGASGTLPGVLYGLKNSLSPSAQKLIEALFVAGLVGRVAFSRGPVSGAQSGCGGEIGIY